MVSWTRTDDLKFKVMVFLDKLIAYHPDTYGTFGYVMPSEAVVVMLPLFIFRGMQH